MEFRAIAPPDTLSKMACLQAEILEGASLPTPMYVQTQELPAVYSSRCLYISCNDCRSACVCPECHYRFAFALHTRLVSMHVRSSIIELVDSICRDGADTPISPIQK